MRRESEDKVRSILILGETNQDNYVENINKMIPHVFKSHKTNYFT